MNREIINKQMKELRSRATCINCIHCKVHTERYPNYVANQPYCYKNAYTTRFLKIIKGIKRISNHTRHSCIDFKRKYGDD